MKRKRVVLILLVVAIVCVLGYVYVYDILLPSSRMKSAKSVGIPNPAVIAHRGASYLAPEETEPAYFLARDMGADYLEIDAQRTKDHVLIAFHDDTPERTTNVAKVFPGREKDTIDTFTIDELKQLDAGSSFNAANPKRARPKYAGVNILTLGEVITIAESGDRKPSIYIETKSPERFSGFEQELVDHLRKRGWLGKSSETGRSKVVFQSFDKSSLQRLKDLAPDVPRVYLFNDAMADRFGWDTLIRDAAALGNGIGPAGNICWPWNLRKAHDAGLLIHIYTVNAAWQFRILSFFGADGFFTDRCDVLTCFCGRSPGAAPQDILAKHGY